MKVGAWLPPFMARRLAGRDTLQRSLDNVFWLTVEQIVRMGVALATGIWVARYLGPEQYGWLSYAMAVVGTVASFTSLGLNAVVVRELAREPAQATAWTGAAFFLKSAGATVGFLVCLGMAAARGGTASPVPALVAIVALGMFFQTFDIIDLIFQAEGAARLSGWIRIGACVAANAVKAALLFAHASLLLLAAAGVLELALTAVGWILAARRRGRRWADLAWHGDHVARLLHESWPLALSGLAVYTQAYADQLVIGQMLGGADLGQYAAAMRVIAVFSFVPMVVQTVAAPEITRAKRDDETLYRRRLHSLYRLMFGLFLLTAVPLIAVGPWFARLLFGAPYAAAAALLPLLALRLFFTNLGVARSVFITNEGLFRFALFTAVVGAALNLLLNVWWVPRWGARGAILASFASFGITTFGFEVFQPAARANLRLMVRAVLLPWRSHGG